MKNCIAVWCVLQAVAGQLLFQCPSMEQWSFRSTTFCNKTHPSYHCLLDLDTNNYREKCMKYPSLENKGHKKVFAGNLHGIKCAKGTYQPFKFWTNGTSDCVYKKSLCNGEGQVVHDTGNNEYDQQCRCDYRQGYDYANKPKHKCYCQPSVEDCTCYKTYCASGEILTQDYDCLSVTAWKVAFQCPELTVFPLVTQQSIELTLDTSKGNNQNHCARLAAKVVSSIAVICVIGMSIVLLCLARVPKDTLSGYAINVTTEDIPLKVKELQQRDVNQWKQKLEKFVTTRASAAILDAVMKIQCIVITGPPGCGKTFTAYYAGLKMTESVGYELLIVNDHNNALKYAKTSGKQLLFIDDLFGKYCIDNSKIDWWKKQEDIVTYLVHRNKELKILATCRSNVFHSFGKNSLFCERSFLSKNVILNTNEKKLIANMYLADIMIDVDDRYIMELDFFPALCSYRTTKDKPTELIPMEYMMQEINILLNCSDPAFLLFALLVVFNNALNVDMLTSEKYKLDEILSFVSREIGFSIIPTKKLLLTYLISLQDSYVIKANNVYSFKSENLCNVITFCTSRHIVKSIMQYRDLSQLKDRCVFESLLEYKDSKQCIVIPEDKEYLYFDGILKEIKSGSYLDIFEDLQNNTEEYRKKFIEYMRKNVQSKNLKMKKNQSSILHVVAELGYKDYLEFFGGLKSLRIDVVDKDKRTPLHIASDKGHTSVADILIDLKANLNAKDEAGNTPLFLACKGGHAKTAALLLSKGAKITQNRITLSYPLHITCKNGQKVISDLLLNNKSSVNVADNVGRTPLILASKGGFNDICVILLHHGADVNSVDNKRRAAVHYACTKNFVDVVEILLSNKADCNLEETDGQKTPLNIVCEKGFCEITELLLSQKVSVNHRDINGNSPLYLACMNGHLLIVQKLLDNNADVNLKNNSDSVPLHAASNKSFRDIVQCLIKYEADVNCVNKDKQTPLHIACQNGNVEIAELLLQKGALVDVKDKDMRTPLHIASTKNNDSIVQIIYFHSKVHCTEDRHKKTPLSIATEKESSEMVPILRCFPDK